MDNLENITRDEANQTIPVGSASLPTISNHDSISTPSQASYLNLSQLDLAVDLTDEVSINSLPTYNSLFPPLQPVEQTAPPPDYDTLFPPRKGLYQRFNEIILGKITRSHIFYFADFIIHIILLCITALYYTKYYFYIICIFTLIPSCFSTITIFLNKKFFIIVSCAILTGCLLILNIASVVYIFMISEMEEKAMFGLYCFFYFISFLLSCWFLLMKERYLDSVIGTGVWVIEFVISLLSLAFLVVRADITFATFCGLFFMLLVSLITYVSLNNILKIKLDRISVRYLFHKNMLVYYIFLGVYCLIQINDIIGAEMSVNNDSTTYKDITISSLNVLNNF